MSTTMRTTGHLLTLLAICLTGSPTTAQRNDSTEYILGGERRISGLGALMLSYGPTDMSDDAFTNTGFGGGALIDQCLLLGAYGQGLSNPLVHQEVVENGHSYPSTFQLNHGGFWSMYAFRPRRNIHPFISAQIGWGVAEWIIDEDPYADGHVPDLKDNVLVYTLCGGVEFNVARWFRPNVYLGFRRVSGLELTNTSRSDLDGFLLGANFCFGGLGDPRKK
jgi:hypothetical protein